MCTAFITSTLLRSSLNVLGSIHNTSHEPRLFLGQQMGIRSNSFDRVHLLTAVRPP
jgi:hypothetical protein